MDTRYFLLFTKVYFSASAGSKVQKKLKTAVPEWFYHLIYAANCGLLFYFGWQYTGLAWLATCATATPMHSVHWHERKP